MKLRSKVFIIFVGLLFIYLLLQIAPAPDPDTLQRYNLSETAARLLGATVFIPASLVWFIALYGYMKLEHYSHAIKNSKDGRQVTKLKNGVFILVLSLPLTAIINRSLELLSRSNPSIDPATEIIRNYVALVLPLAAFVLISAGAHGLADLARKKPSQRVVHALFLAALTLGLTYVYLIARAPGTIHEQFHMTLAPFLFTLILPYTYMWYIGLFAAYEILLYSRKVNGIVYRKSWQSMSYGLIAIIVFSILLQYLGTLSEQLEGLSLGGLLVLLYVLLSLWAVSYLLVASGAKKLMLIEEA